MPVTVKNPAEQQKMREAGRLAAEVLDMIGAHASLSDDSQLARDGAALELREPPAAAVAV